MASITCRNGGSVHQHTSVTESKICYGIIRTVTAPPPLPPDLATLKQLKFIEDLGGDKARAASMTKKQASAYIDELKKRPKVTVTPAPAAEEEPPPVEVAKTSKSDMIKTLISMVPDGYYAVREQDGAPITFLKVSRPKRGNFRDCIKISSQHGPSLEVRWVLWPSGRVSVYRWPGHEIEDDLLLLMADWKSATRLYAEKKKKCGRCNTDLTDPRSRFYLIGPECEKHWQWWIDDVAAERGGYWEQQPLSVQEKYLPAYTEL